jgi:hypothetical protein
VTAAPAELPPDHRGSAIDVQFLGDAIQT